MDRSGHQVPDAAEGHAGDGPCPCPGHTPDLATSGTDERVAAGRAIDGTADDRRDRLDTTRSGGRHGAEIDADGERRGGVIERVRPTRAPGHAPGEHPVTDEHEPVRVLSTDDVPVGRENEGILRGIARVDDREAAVGKHRERQRHGAPGEVDRVPGTDAVGSAGAELILEKVVPRDRRVEREIEGGRGGDVARLIDLANADTVGPLGNLERRAPRHAVGRVFDPRSTLEGCHRERSIGGDPIAGARTVVVEERHDRRVGNGRVEGELVQLRLGDVARQIDLPEENPVVPLGGIERARPGDAVVDGILDRGSRFDRRARAGHLHPQARRTASVGDDKVERIDSGNEATGDGERREGAVSGPTPRRVAPALSVDADLVSDVVHGPAAADRHRSRVKSGEIEGGAVDVRAAGAAEHAVTRRTDPG